MDWLVHFCNNSKHARKGASLQHRGDLLPSCIPLIKAGMVLKRRSPRSLGYLSISPSSFVMNRVTSTQLTEDKWENNSTSAKGAHWWAAILYKMQRNPSGLHNRLDCLYRHLPVDNWYYVQDRIPNCKLSNQDRFFDLCGMISKLEIAWRKNTLRGNCKVHWF